MPITIRPYRDEDWPQAAAIWSLAFYGGQPMDAGEEALRPIGVQTIVAEDEDGLAGALRRRTFHTLCRGVTLKGAGLSAVAVAPEHRRQGVGSAMLHWLLWQMRREGVAVASLHAANEAYYRRFGWAAAGSRVELTARLNWLPRLETDLPIHRLTLNDWRELEPAYAAFARRYSGMNTRRGLELSFIHRTDGNEPVVYAIGSPAEAYAVLRMKRNHWDRPFVETVVSEMVWASPRGYRALLGMLGQLCINSASLSWFEPAESPFLALHSHRDTQATIRRPLMYRLIDVPAALAALPVPAGAEGSWTLAVEDEVLPDNAGPWRVTVAEGQVAVEPAPGEAADLSMGIGALTQAVLGEPSLAALAAHGAVAVRRDEALAQALTLLPPHPVYCIDFF